MSLRDSPVAATALMNRIYQRQRYLYDLTRKYYLLGRDPLIERLDPPRAASVLEVGCGTGRNLIVAARRYPQAEFFGIDVSTEMLTTAIDAIARAGLSARVRVAHADAIAFDGAALFGRARFERVFVSYSLSTIPRWDAALNRAIQSLKAGGDLHAVDFGTFEGLPAPFGGLFRSWLALFRVSPRERLELWLTLRGDQLGAKSAFERWYRGYAQYARLRMPG